MREFYKRVWGKGQVSKAEALRQAQVLMIERWDLPRADFRGPTEPRDAGGPVPPYFWAAFTLSGDWR
jgi:CHAT domain-containing protein